MLSKEQLAMRNNGIGGTGAAVIMGEGFMTPYQLWLSKLGLVDNDVDNEFVEWGNRHEETIAKKFIDSHPALKVDCANITYVDAEHEWCYVTPDGEITWRPEATIGVDDDLINWLRTKNLIGEDGILEIKTTSEYAKDKWGEEQTDEIPKGYIIQTQWYMKFRNKQWAVVAVLIGGNKYREYYVKRNDKLIHQIFDACKAFWFDNVKAEVEPELTDRDGDALKQRYPEETEPLMISTPELDELALTWKKLNAEINIKDADRELAKNKIMAILKDAVGVKGEWGSIRFGTRKGGVAYKDIVAKAIYAGDIAAEEIERNRRESYRSLNPYFKKDKK